MAKVLLLFLPLLLAACASSPARPGPDPLPVVTPPPPEGDARIGRGTVFLLHGALRSPASMAPLARALRRAGFHVVNTPMPRLGRTLEENASDLAKAVEAEAGRGPFHFVTHSYGGLVARTYLARAGCADPGRLVMIGPPNQGSVLAERLRDQWLFRRILRKAVEPLQPDPEGHHERIGLPPVEFGIIAGGRGDGRGWNPFVPGDDDGIVAVSETRLEGAKDHLVLPRLHTFLMTARATHLQVVHFLETGEFAR